ncbi:MAG: S16 family serine protease [Archaeoglobaceae archaeon]
MKRFLLPLILIFFLSIHTADAQFVNESEVTIKAVAVTTGETSQGVAINITALITPGNGKIFVSTTPYTQIDMQGSAQLSALTACDVLGKDFLDYNFFYTIEATSPIVGGPSAGGVMTIATMAALQNLTISEDIYMTGMIYPDGSIGAVGGIPSKLRAAADRGADTFLIPQGQRTVVVEEVVTRERGPFIYRTIETKEIDLLELGDELGVKVAEVNNVDDAFAYYTGYSISKPNVTFNISQYSDITVKLADKMKSDALELLEEAKGYAQENELASIRNTIDQAEENYEEGDYYTSTSQYFQAKIDMRYLIYRHTLTTQNIDEEFKRVEEEVDFCIRCLEDYETMGVNSFQLIGAAEERIKKAERYLSDAKSSEDFDGAINNLALARERVESAKSWLSLLETIDTDIKLDEEQVKRRAQFYLSQAESLVVYSSSIGGHSVLINRARESADLSSEMLDDGFYAGAITSAIDSIVKTSISVELVGATEQQIAEKTGSAENSAKSALSEAQFINPILPAAYFEFANNMDNNLEKLMYYKLSERLAKTMLIMAKENLNRTLVKVEIPPYNEPSTYSTVDAPGEQVEIPGFELLTAVAAISICYCAYRSHRWR